MDFEVIKTYIPLFKKAMFLTLRIGWLGIGFAILIGALSAICLYLRIPVLRQFVISYIELFRNTPLLIQLFFLYFALPKVGIRMNAEFCGILGVSLLGGAYMADVFRSGLESVKKVQKESALSLGMTNSQMIRLVILPQAISVSIPGITANTVFLLKETSVFSAISLMDLMFTAKDLIGLYYRTEECLLLLVVFYLIILLPVSVLGYYLERRLGHAQLRT